ncbi:MAG: hypothetical protein IJ561_03460 [Ruminococcus sp.]|nr:hypothetical protein [Ruminococcus sp.]
MNLKRIFASVCALAMSAALLASCGDSDSSSTAATDSKEEATTTTTTAAQEEETTTTTTAAETETTTTTTEAAAEPEISTGDDIEIPNGETKYYVWGGGNVTWAMDLDNDDTNNVEGTTEGNQFPGVGVDGYEQFWVGLLDTSEGTATLTIPVVKGAVVQFIAGGWESYEGVQYSVTVGNKKGEVSWKAADEENKRSLPTFTYLVEDDVTEITADIYYYDRTDGAEDPLFNDYCQGFVHVIYPE